MKYIYETLLCKSVGPYSTKISCTKINKTKISH